jgi:hypothetical protein
MGKNINGIVFVKGPGFKKYTAILPNGKKVHFGDKRYEQYKDSVPKNRGVGYGLIKII